MANGKSINRWTNLLQPRDREQDDINEIKGAPILTEAARVNSSKLAQANDAAFSQFGLLAGIGDAESNEEIIHYNVAAPSSIFVCGSQGSGKSHTLSCLLENCLLPSEASELPHPLTGIVFHYDTFFGDEGGSPCEAAFLSDRPEINVRVLCAPTNIATIKATYARFPNVTVEELRIDEKDLNTKRMMEMMAVKAGNTMPLYIQVVKRILRDLRLEQQATGRNFSYNSFRAMIDMADLTDGQRGPLEQRLDTLESFMARKQQQQQQQQQMTQPKVKQTMVPTAGVSWASNPGQLTIVDLSCPTVDSESACQLFNICLSLFLEQDPNAVGRVIALDEAHKYMDDSGEASVLTEQLLSTIRLQRHLGARVIISTQEPTVSPKLLDLCSVTVVHRFTSPEWLRALEKHLAGVSKATKMLEKGCGGASGTDSDEEWEDEDGEGVGASGLTLGLRKLRLTTTDEAKCGSSGGDKEAMMDLIGQIVELGVGEALLFAPNAVLDVQRNGKAKKLGNGMLKVRIRARVTADGGRSVMAG